VRALIVGRFQPFHKGHLSAALEVLSKCDDLVIVIGSAEESHTMSNPFTASERYQMILSSLPKDAIPRVQIVPVRDVNRYAIWVGHIESYVPPFDVVYSNNALTRSLFSQVGYEVKKTRAYNGKLYSGTEIRRRMLSGERWQHLVPPEVASMAEEIGARDRLANASGRKTPIRRKSCARR
jgi:nicotinamide-nucleotide adenylyltransferase